MAKICPQCEQENPSSANFCMYCQTQLTEELSEEVKRQMKLNEAEETIKVLTDALKEKEKEKEKEINKPQEVILPLPPPSPPPAPPAPAPPVPERREKEKKSFPYSVLIVGLLLLLVVGGSISYFAFFKDYFNDNKAPRFHTFANGVFIRSSQLSGVSHNLLGKIPYGSELIVYNNEFEWSEVKWKDNLSKKSIKGYVSSDYILPAEDFKILNSIWGDAESKEIINTAKCRIALLNYCKEKGLNGWKVYSKNKDSKYNTTYFKRIVNPNSKFTDFAVILKNDYSNERKCALFSFDDNETPRLEYEEQAPSTGDIVSISYKVDPIYYTGEYLITYR